MADGDGFSRAATIGDLNGDGIVDLAVGAALDDDGGTPPNANRGAVWVLFLDGIRCELQTNYDPVGCSGTFQAFSLADLDQYIADDFGRNGSSNYQNLKLMVDLTDDILDIESPCSITLNNDIVLTGDFVSLDGRKGVLDDNGYTVNATKACILSEQDNAGIGAGSVIDVGELTIQAEKTAKIGLNSAVNVGGELAVISTGDFTSSNAIIKAGSAVVAGLITMEASRGAHLGENTIIDTTGDISLISTGTTSASDAGLKSGADVTADNLFISASREAKVGQNTEVLVSGDLVVTSTGTATGSHAIVKSGADVTAGADMELTSGNKATIGQNTTIAVTDNLHMDAASPAKCTIKNSAVITAGSTSGNCLPFTQPFKTVFVSSQTYTGNLGGLSGADATCQALANNAGLLGTFKAWLSDSTGSPSTRFVRSEVPYVRVDGVEVAYFWRHLVDKLSYPLLLAPIETDEYGQLLPITSERSVWTHTLRDGTSIGNLPTSPANPCNDWSVGTSGNVLHGSSTSVGDIWTAQNIDSDCNYPRRLYCFQQ